MGESNAHDAIVMASVIFISRFVIFNSFNIFKQMNNDITNIHNYNIVDRAAVCRCVLERSTFANVESL